ncbi:MAG: flavodoxin domain-containing protein [Candidatus Omnitrophica bacterium]|nr:flavodoxin domain-containing protein [Candidatus Omnitrophota bacterium]
MEIRKNIFWVGAVDWNVRNFHGHTYTTKRGTTYNAYLVVDEKVALIDTVYAPFADEMIEKISEIIPPEKIDYIIANHVETDHSGALPRLLERCPRAKVVGTQKCKEGLYKNYYGNWDFQVVKSGDSIDLGRRSLTFLEAPMIHWPDSMFTYCPQEQLLMPNDAFGQHYATSERFDDETDQCALMEEAKSYYANILWPLGSVILKKIEEVKKMNIPITMIAPSHGIIWRKDPARIVNAYASWAANKTEASAVVVYETMWKATEKMARAITQGLTDSGVRVKLYDIAESDRTDVITQMLEAKGFVFGSSTHDNDMLPALGGFLELFKGLRPKGRVAFAFGSYGWAGGAVKEIEGVLQEAGVETAMPGIGIQYAPTAEDLKRCYEQGKAFAEEIKRR